MAWIVCKTVIRCQVLYIVANAGRIRTTHYCAGSLFAEWAGWETGIVTVLSTNEGKARDQAPSSPDKPICWCPVALKGGALTNTPARAGAIFAFSSSCLLFSWGGSGYVIELPFGLTIES